MGHCYSSLTNEEIQINDFWKDLKLRKIQPVTLEQTIKNKTKITNSNSEVPDFSKDFIDPFLSNDEYNKESTAFFSELLEKYSKETDTFKLKYFFLSLYFLTSPNYMKTAKNFFKKTTETFYINFTENEKKVTTYNKELLKNIVLFYVNLISLETVNHYGPFKEDPHNPLKSAFSLENQYDYVNQLFEDDKEFEGKDIKLDIFWKLTTILFDDVEIRGALMDLNIKKMKRNK